MQKILICTNHFYPETFRVNDLAFGLAERGYDVTVLTAIPDYPKGKYYDGYGIFRRRCETVRGVKVIRGFIIPRGKGGSVRLMLNYLSFLLSSVFISLYLGLFRRFDRVFVHETSPVMIGIPAVIVKKLRRIPLLFWVLDLWPESLQAAGGVNNKRVLGAFDRLTRWIYKNSDKILISSQSFGQAILSKGDFQRKIVYFPNWADTAMEASADYQLPPLPAGFMVMFAGNMGEAQDFEHILEAARLLASRRDVHFVFLGDGRKLAWTQNFVREHHLEETVHLLGRHPVEAMPSFFARASVMLIALKDNAIFNLTVPAKLQAYMSTGKPILAMMNGEGPRIVADAGCGRSVPAGDAAGLAEAVVEMAALDQETLDLMGSKGKAYQQEHFNIDKRMAHLEALLQEQS